MGFYDVPDAPAVSIGSSPDVLLDADQRQIRDDLWADERTISACVNQGAHRSQLAYGRSDLNVYQGAATQ